MADLSFYFDEQLSFQTGVPIEIKVDSELLKFEFPVMLFFSILILPIMMTGKRISRIEGILLLVLYAVFIYMVFS